MRLQLLISSRKLSTTSRCLHPYLSDSYKSKDLWNQRFNCKILTSNDETIKTINFKIMQDESLSNLELDIFINNSMPRTEDVVQLQETANQLKKFRRTLYAHTLLPSTPQALCRLFLSSERLESLARLLDKRVEFGIFPDFFSYNLIIEKAIDQGNFAIASKIASLIMLQEEFGVNPITDRLSLFALVKYAESKTDFKDWIDGELSTDKVFNDDVTKEIPETTSEVSEKKKETNDDEDEDQDDAEYIRIPFLRNPYFDNHFDIKNPRVIIGKSLCLLSQSILCDKPIKIAADVLGLVLQGKWVDATMSLNSTTSHQSYFGSIKQVLLHYINNLDDLQISEEEKDAITAQVEKLNSNDEIFSESIENNLLNGKLSEFETNDIIALKQNFSQWSDERVSTEKRIEDLQHRKKIKEAIEAKKEELKFKEQYLYFYDNLKKSRLTRINYD